MKIFTIFLFIIIQELKSLTSLDVKNIFKNLKKFDRQSIKQTKIQFEANENSLEYPGNQPELIEQIKEQWQEYYHCLINKKKSFENKIEKPVIRQLLEGQYAELECSVCERPFQNYDDVEWKYKPFDENVTEFDQLDLPYQMTLTDEKSLQIFNIQVGFSGIYVCFQSNTSVSLYVIEVSNDLKLIKIPSDAPVKNETVPGTQFQVFREWSNWTECSTCGEVGKMFKYGLCMVSLTENNTEVEKDKVGSLTAAMEVVSRFKTGMPCNSIFLPKVLLKYEEIRNQPAEVSVEFCKVPCPGPVIFEVKDRFGKIIEMANNSAGIFSSFQKLPKLKSDVERKTVTGEFGSNVVLSCPGNFQTDTPFTWKIKNLTIIPELIEEQSSGRITIDLLNRLNIQRIRKKDSKIYSCWQRDKLAGTIFLEVEKKFKFKFNHHVMLISLLLIILTFIMVVVKVLARYRQTKKKKPTT